MTMTQEQLEARPASPAPAAPDVDSGRRRRAGANDEARYPTPAHPLAELLHGASELAFERLGPKCIAAFLRRRDLIWQRVEQIPERMQKVTNQARLAGELVSDFQAGRYRSTTWRSIVLAAGALVYTVSPMDLVPDVVPGLGTLDDLLVTGLALRLIRRDLEAYCRNKGYDPAIYF
jgi:uncharacterized membrane protein YkvA (DUF1232 family)